MKIIANTHPALKGFDENDSLKGAYFAESLDPLKNSGAQILASLNDGTPGIIASKYGKGETILIGSFLGMANHSDSDQKNNQFLMNLLDWAKIDRPVTTSHDGKIDTPIEVRMQSHGNGLLMFIINHSENDEAINIQIQVNKDQNFTCREIISNRKFTPKSKNKILNFDTQISRRSIEVWDIR